MASADVPAPLLRLLASVAPGTAVVVDAGDAAARALDDALARLGLRPVPLPEWRPDDPGEQAAWAALVGLPVDALEARLAAAARALAPGGWAWVEAPAEAAHVLSLAAQATAFVEVHEPAPDAARATVHALYRRGGGIL